MKKVLCLVLAIVLITGLLPGVSLAESESEQKVFEQFRQYLVKSETLSDDGYIGIPVDLNVYCNDPDGGEKEVILYVMHFNGERIGQEDDASILKDYINEGYIVVTADYRSHPLSVSPAIDWSLAKLKSYYRVGSGFSGTNLKMFDQFLYVLPAGYRLAKDIEFWNIEESASVGTLDYIVQVWNDTVVPKFGEKYNLEPAKTIDDCVKPDGSPIQMELNMDIIYPSNPSRAVPVYMQGATQAYKPRNTLDDTSPHFVGFTMRGYATVIYDHEYIPMARDGHYGYFAPYSIARWNGVKAHTAAVRCVRYFADTYGYNADLIGVAGHSKSSYGPGLLANPRHNEIGELSTFSGEAVDPTYGPQPFLTYDDGTPISDAITVAYTSMGDGTKRYERLASPDNVPTIIACGELDQYGCWDYWPALKAHYREIDIPQLAFGMLGIGHNYPYGYDADLGFDRYQPIFDFFDRYLKPELKLPAKLVYSTPLDNAKDVSPAENIVVKFVTPMEEASINDGIYIVDETTGASLEGSWSAAEGKTEWTFCPVNLVPGHVIRVEVTRGVKTVDGSHLEETSIKRFQIAGDRAVEAASDAMVSSASPDENFGTGNTITLSKQNGQTGYVQFNGAGFENVYQALLQFGVENDCSQGSQAIDVYGLVGQKAAFDETGITQKSAPGLLPDGSLDAASCYGGGVLGGAAVTGAGWYSVDVTDYLQALSGNLPTFVLKARFSAGEVFCQPFEAFTVSNATIQVSANQPYSETYNIRFGGAPVGAQVVDNETGGKSLLFQARNNYDRIKFYNSLFDRALTEADVGRSFEIAFRLKSNKSGNVLGGVMSATGGGGNDGPVSSYTQDFYQNKSLPVKAGAWAEFTIPITVDKTMVEQQIGMFTLQTNIGCSDNDRMELEIDDIVVTEIAQDLVISAKESGRAPRLVLFEREAEQAVSVANAYISADDADTTYAGQLIADAGTAGFDGESKKAYVRIPLAGVDASAGEYTFSFTTEKAAKQAICVYGLDAGEENANAPNQSEGSVHNWNQSSITWRNAPANDRNGFGVQTSAVFGGAPIATFNADTTTFEVDATDYIKKLLGQGAPFATFILTAAHPNGKQIYTRNFEHQTAFVSGQEEETLFSETADFRYGGNTKPANLVIDASYNHTPGGSASLLFKGRTQAYDRIKLFNSLTGRPLTQADLGRVFQVRLWAYADQATSSGLRIGVMPAVGGDTFTTFSDTPFQTDKWVLCEQTVTITQNHIDNQAGMLTIESNGAIPEFWIDDIEIWEVSEDVSVISNHQNAQTVPVLDLNFNGLDALKFDNTSPTIYSDAHYRVGGPSMSQSSVTLDAQNDRNGNGKSVKLTRGASDDRIKFYNTFYKDRNFTEADIGKQYMISFWVKTDVAGTLKVSIMPASGWTSYGPPAHMPAVSANTWEKIEFPVTVTSAMILNQAGLLTVESDGEIPTIWIDDLKVESTQITIDANSPIPKLTADDSTYFAATDTVTIQSDAPMTNAGSAPLMQLSSQAAAPSISGVKKAYMQFGPLKNEVTEASLHFTAQSEGDQTLLVYGVPSNLWSADTLTWNNAPANDTAGKGIFAPNVSGAVLVGTVAVKAGTQACMLDVTEFIKAHSDGVTFVVTAQEEAGIKWMDWNFETEDVLQNGADYRKAGAYVGDVSVSQEQNHTPNGTASLKMDGINNNYSRLKLLNVFGNAPLTADDIGRKFKISCYVMPLADGYSGNEADRKPATIEGTTVQMGVYGDWFGSATSTTVGAAAKEPAKVGEWTKCSIDFEITQEVVDKKATTLGFCQASADYTKTLYLDDLTVTEVGGSPVTILALQETLPVLNSYQEVVPEPVTNTFVLDLPLYSTDGLANESVLLTAVAGPYGTEVEQVEFFANGKQILAPVTQNGAVYCIRMTDFAPGNYAVYAVATYRDGTSHTTGEQTVFIKDKTVYTVESETTTGKIAAGSAYGVTRTLKNNTETDTTCVLIVAVYDENDHLLAIDYSEEHALPAGQSAECSVSFDSLPAKTAYTKVFSWHSLAQALPMVKVVVME